MDDRQKIEWADLLKQAVDEPGLVSEAYRQFHGYSIGNQILVLVQCLHRNIQPSPMAGYKKWKKLGRQVRKGERAIGIWIPISWKAKVEDEETGEVTEEPMTTFKFKFCVFVMSQTDGDEVEFPEVDGFDRAKALETLDLTEIGFDELNGNVAGFSRSNGVSVNPLGSHKFRTWVHEAAHGLLHQNGNGDGQGKAMRELEAEGVALIVCEALEMEGSEYSRGYIQNWWGRGNPVPEASARRIFSVANKILEAGRRSDN